MPLQQMINEIDDLLDKGELDARENYQLLEQESIDQPYDQIDIPRQ